MRLFRFFRKSAEQPLHTSGPTNPASVSVRTPPPGEPGEIVFYATPWCGDCHRARRVFSGLGVPYRYVDIHEDSHARELVMRLNGGMRSVPTIVFPDGDVLVEPSNAELEARLGQYVAG